MPVSVPPQEALDEFLGATTRHVRRIEIFEADGVTRWAKDTASRLKDGSVAVDYDRDERRSLDLTLDNSDGVLVNAPGEFWYDKIIKVYRGVQVNQKKRNPKVLIISDSTTDPHAVEFRKAVAALGYGDTQVNVLASNYELDVAPYDIIVALGGEDKSDLLVKALQERKSVFVFRQSATDLMNNLLGVGSWGESLTTVDTTIRPRKVSDQRTLGWQGFKPDATADDYLAPKQADVDSIGGFGVAYARTITLSSVLNLSDTFDFADSGKWFIGDGCSFSGGQLVLTSNTGYTGWMGTAKNYDLTDSSVHAQLVTPSTGTGGGAETYLQIGVGSNQIYIAVTGGELHCGYQTADGGDTLRAIAYDSVNHAWLRVRHFDGLVRYETSADGVTWIEQSSFAPTFDITSLQVSIAAGYYDSNTTSATNAVWDNLNILADGVTPVASSIKGADSYAISSFQSDVYGKAMLVHYPLNATQYAATQFSNMMRSAMSWLNPVIALKTWEVQIGEFMIDRISEAHFPHDVKITGRDYTKKCLMSKYAQATQFDAGQTLEGLIGVIATAAGITKRLLPVTGIVVGQSFFFDRNTSRWDAMKQIATAYNYEIYFDAAGYLVIRPFRDPTTSAPVIWIETGLEGQIATYEKSTADSSLFNHILVTGESSDQNVFPVYAEAINHDLNSKTSVEEIGDRYWEYSSPLITEQQQAQNLADTYLRIHSLEEFELNFETLLLPWLEVGDILGFIDPNPAPGDPNTFLLSSLTLPLGLAAMSGVGKRVLIVGM